MRKETTTEINREKRQKILICDSESLYGERLLEYLQQNLSFPCDVELYTSSEKLMQFGKPEEASLVILSEREYCEDIRQMTWVRHSEGNVYQQISIDGDDLCCGKGGDFGRQYRCSGHDSPWCRYAADRILQSDFQMSPDNNDADLRTVPGKKTQGTVFEL